MKLSGLIAATYTPFHADGSLHLELIPGLTDHMLERGVAGLYVCGSTGEGESLTQTERQSVAEAFVTAAQGRVPVVVQVGHNSLATARELARHAHEIGADAISSLPPTYFKPASQDELLSSIASVAEAAPALPYYYYHIPRLSGVAIDPEPFLEAVEDRIPSFAGIKFSDFFLADLTTCLTHRGGKYDIPFGSDEMFLGALATGATGAVGSCYGFAAPLWLEILRAYERRELDEAQAWMQRAVQLVRLLAGSPGPFQAVVRQVVWPLLGFNIGPMRLPQPTLTTEAMEQATRGLEESGLAEEIRSGRFTC